jgi:flagellar hook-basal body complex protein FliE
VDFECLTVTLNSTFKQQKRLRNSLAHNLIIKNRRQKMNDNITKDDLKQFGLLLVEQFKQIIETNQNKENDNLNPEWLKSRVVRKLMDMSAASLQNLRITKKVRFKKVLGSYYYNKSDLMNLFNDIK